MKPQFYLRPVDDGVLIRQRRRQRRQRRLRAPIPFAPGCYEVRRQREYTPEGLRRVED